MTELAHLFQPIKVGSMELKNRLVFLAVMTGYSAGYEVTERLKAFYAERARGGTALLTTGILPPSSLGSPFGAMTGIFADRFIPGLRQFTDEVHRNGARFAAQLGLQYYWAKSEDSPMEEVAPSAVATRRAPPPREFTIEEIEQMVDDFSEAARRARDAGFDAVEFHAGIGYMINRFLSSCTNKRSDRYGGSLEGRARFLLEIVESTKKKAGADYPIICRISADEFMEGGNTLDDSRRIAAMLEQAGVACLSIQAGWHECPRPLVHMSVPRGAFVYQAEEIKRAVSIPVVAAYRINDPVLADDILARGQADLIGMARPLIADPSLPQKASQGRLDEIRTCIACGHCLDTVMTGMSMACAINPMVGHEAEYTVEPAREQRRVFVIGGGPAGMEAAAIAAQRGHQVALWERGQRLGGNLIPAAVPQYKAEIRELIRYLEGQVQRSGVEVHLGEEASADTVLQTRPDAVVVATGAQAKLPDLPGFDRPNVATAIDVLMGRREVGQNVIVVGGEMVGCEVADYLAEQGKRVTLLARRHRVGDDVGRTTRWVIVKRLGDLGVHMETQINVLEVTDDGVRCVHKESGEEIAFAGDSVVLAVGMAPDDALSQALDGKVPALYSIGDCAQGEKIVDAIEGGFRVGREL